ncbi:MAG: cohesin domain-containing protein, partial [Pyrinomonadaceae bacterium]
LGREIRVGSSKAATGDQVTVPIEMIPYGDEVGVGFTLEYDPAVLQNPRVVLEDGVLEGAVLTVNDLEKGKLGILVDATGPITASAVGVRFVTVTFDVAEKTRGVTMIDLTDSLASRAASDAQGKTLSTRWLGGSIEILGRKPGIEIP